MLSGADYIPDSDFEAIRGFGGTKRVGELVRQPRETASPAEKPFWPLARERRILPVWKDRPLNSLNCLSCLCATTAETTLESVLDHRLPQKSPRRHGGTERFGAEELSSATQRETGKAGSGSLAPANRLDSRRSNDCGGEGWGEGARANGNRGFRLALVQFAAIAMLFLTGWSAPSFAAAETSAPPAAATPAAPTEVKFERTRSVEVLATILFALAILHTFSVKYFAKLAHNYPEGSIQENLYHFLAETEVVFGVWAAALFAGIMVFKGSLGRRSPTSKA